jgi:hypothetical protein
MSTPKHPFIGTFIESIHRTKGLTVVVMHFLHGNGGKIVKTFNVPDSGTATDELGVPLSGASLTTLQTSITTLDTNLLAFIAAMDAAHKLDL